VPSTAKKSAVNVTSDSSLLRTGSLARPSSSSDDYSGMIFSEPSGDRLLCNAGVTIGDHKDAGHDAAMAATVQPVPKPPVREVTNL
jgi:hypothetical protein